MGMVGLGILLGLLLHAQTNPKPDEPCLQCHSDIRSADKKYQHPELECKMCHLPHGINGKADLIGDPTTLCQEPCHGVDNLGRSHPFGYGVEDPLKGGTLSCTSTCHDPHASKYKRMLRYKPRELCFKCHDK